MTNENDRGPILLVTGMSGAGRSTALRAMEDMGYEAVDNLPLRLLEGVIRREADSGRRMAVGVDVRSRGFTVAAFMHMMARVRAGDGPRILFLDCDDEVLRRRYTETRRGHPLAHDRPVSDGIARERAMLAPLRGAADMLLDTSRLNVHALGQRIRDRLGGGAGLHIFISSFSFRQGLPRDADLVFDVRFLRNPHYEPELRALTGHDPAVAAYVGADAAHAPFLRKLEELFALLMPAYLRDGRNHLTIAIGCTGGQRRSVYIALELGRRLRAAGHHVAVAHDALADDGAKTGTGEPQS